jgi:hypothetical protein
MYLFLEIQLSKGFTNVIVLKMGFMNARPPRVTKEKYLKKIYIPSISLKPIKT